MNSKVGCSWRQLELRGQQNAAKSKQIFGALSPPHSFVVERENDGNSLLRFMKVVVPEYRELIPPPCLSTGFRFNQNRHNARIQGTAEPIGVTAPRQFRQNSETTMALNAFSDLEAIAEMGAGTDDAETQVSESATRPPSKLTEHCSPTVVGNSFLSLPQQNAAVAAAPCDQRVRTEQHNATGGNPEPQQQLAQLSVEQQQQQHRHRFGMNVVYRQQQPKLQQQPLVPMGGMNPAAGRMAMDTPPGLRHSASSDVFNFVPDHSPFDGAPNFATVSANPYQSPTGGITRRRGRGRRAGNVGDRQPSTSSSVEHEGTPESPSDFGTLRKHRGSGTPGQRRARKPRKPMNIGGFDPQEGISLSRSPYQSAESHSIMGQLPPLAATSSNYISPQIEEDIRSKMMTDYEMHFCESSSDDEMDPPPPPKNLVMPPKSAHVDCEQKVPSSSELDSAASACAVGAAERPSLDGGGERKCVPPSAKCSIPSGHSNGEQQPTDVGRDPSQKAPLLQEIKHISTAPSSVSSSPSLSQLGEQSDHRISLATIVKSELDAAGFKRAENAKLGDIFDNEVGTTSIKIKKEADLDRLKQAKDVQAHGNLVLSKLSCAERAVLPPKESAGKKDGVELGAKRPALVLKIKKEGASSSAASTKHSSSSSSPSSTSSSSAVTSAAVSVPIQQLPPQQQQQQQQDEPVARLSSSAAPPSKYKQQRQQTKRPAGKDETTAAAVPAKKKQRKMTTDAGERPTSPSPAVQQQHRPPAATSSNTATKWVKEGGGVTPAAKGSSCGGPQKKEPVPNVMSQITAAPFPNLKNFKIPKVIESADPPPAASCSAVSQHAPNKGGVEHQQQQQSGQSSDKTLRNKFGLFKSADHFVEQRRPGAGAKQTAKGAGHAATHYQYSDKFAASVGGGGGGGVFQSHNLYNNRQRAQKQQMGGGGRHGGNSEMSRKHGPPAPSATRPLPPSASSAVGHRFTVQFQQHPRDIASSHHQPLPPPLQHFPPQQQQQQQQFQQQQQQFSVGWQPIQQPSAAEFFHQQQHHTFLPPQQQQQQQQQRLDWFGQTHDQAEQQRQPVVGHSAVRPGQTRATERQGTTNGSANCREEDRTDNSPSAGNGLQIVDDE